MDTAASTSGSDYGPLHFPPTRWTLVLDAGHHPERAQQAMCELCERYCDAIAAWFKLQRRDDAADLAQQFITRWLTANRLGNIQKREGCRFRFYLVTALSNFLNDHRRWENAEKRPQQSQHVSVQGLADQGIELPNQDSAQPSSLDCDLSLNVHRHAMAALKQAARDSARFGILSRFIPFEQWDAAYAETAVSLGLSEGAVRTAVSRLRDDYFEAFRSEIVQMTRGGPVEANEETRYLLELLSAALERQAAAR